MPIYTKKSNGTWSTNVKKVFVKWSDGLWKTATRVLAKTPSGWVQMWPGDAPANNPNDPVNIRLNSYNGTVASSPQYINTVLYGHDNNGASVIGATPITITNRKMQLATDNTGQTDRYQVESSDIYDLTSNSETNVAEKRFYADAWWLFYQLDATNVWATTRIFSANPIKIIKQAPTFNTGSTNFSEGTGASPLFTVNFSFSDTWWKSARLYDSYVRWWQNTSKSPGGTILKTTYIDDISGLSTNRSGGVYEEYDGQGTTVSGTDYYTAVGGVPSGQYIVAEIVLVNSYTDHYSSPVSTYFASGDKPLITAISVTDQNGNGVMDNQSSPKIMSDGYLYVTATVANAAASTYYLLEPRFYNNQSGAYYRWNSTTLSDYNSWPDDLTPTTNTLSGTTATVTWRIDINADLLYGIAGPTYNTGQARWSLEFRVSARASSSSTNASASYFDGIATLGASNVYMGGIDLPAMINIAPSSAMTLNVSSATPQPNTPITFSISTSSYPSGYSSFPRRYFLDFGDGSTPVTGTFSTGTSNPSVSNISKTYTTAGTYTATLTWEPQGYPFRSTTSRSINVSTPQYQVTWNGNGGSTGNEGTPWTFTTGGSVTVPSVSRIGYTFVRWADTPSGDYTYTTTASGGGTFFPPSQNITMYARWQVNVCTIPDVIGMTEYDAAIAVNNAGFLYEYTEYTNTNNSSLNGKVAAISPAVGSQPGCGTNITLTIYNYVASLTPPSIYYVASGTAGGPVTAYFSGGSGPYYQIWWTTGVGGTSYDEYGSSSPITDNTGPGSAGTWYMYVRSVSSPTNTGLGPSATISDWSAGYQFTVSAPVVTCGDCQDYGSATYTGQSTGCVSTYYTVYSNYVIGQRKTCSDGTYQTCSNRSYSEVASSSQIDGQCGYVAPACVCNYQDMGSYHYSPQCCPSGSQRTGSLSGTTSGSCCPNVNKTLRYVCKSYDVTNSASVNYYDCYSVGQCAAQQNPDGSRSTCYI